MLLSIVSQFCTWFCACKGLVIFFVSQTTLLAQNSSGQIHKSELLTIESWFQRDFWIHQLPMEHQDPYGCLFSDKTFFEKQVIYSGDYIESEIFWNSNPINIHLCSWDRKLQMSQGKSIFEVFLAQPQLRENKRSPNGALFFCMLFLALHLHSWKFRVFWWALDKQGDI